MPLARRQRGSFTGTGYRDPRLSHLYIQRSETVRRMCGVNVHLSPAGSTVTNTQQAQLAAAAGFGWVRIGSHDETNTTAYKTGHNTGANLADLIDRCVARGLRYTLIPNSPDESLAVVAAALPLVGSDRTYCLGVENFNEPDINGKNQAACAAQHTAISSMLTTAGWTSTPIIAPSLNDPGNAGAYSAISGAVYGNYHGYRQPGGAMDRSDWTTAWDSDVNPFTGLTRPHIVTEFGYSSGTNPAADYPNIAVSEEASGILNLRALLATRTAPNDSVQLTALYMLHNEPATTGREPYYGITNANGTPKAAYTIIARALNYLADVATDATTFVLRPIGWTLTGGVRALMLQKSNGRYYLAFWQYQTEVMSSATSNNSSPYPTGTFTLPAGVATTLTLDRAMSAINVYRPYDDTTTTLPAGTTAALTAQGDIQIVELVP